MSNEIERRSLSPEDPTFPDAEIPDVDELMANAQELHPDDPEMQHQQTLAAAMDAALRRGAARNARRAALRKKTQSRSPTK